MLFSCNTNRLYIADGFAVGTSVFSQSGHQTMNILVIVAILMHKVPAALGLATYLISSGLEKRSVMWFFLSKTCQPYC